MRFLNALFLILLFAGPVGWAAEPPSAEIAEFLRTIPAIRVKVEMAPGNGHQTANLRLVQRLRELGYQGRVQMIYDDGVAPKFRTLIPGFNEAEKGLQRVTVPKLGELELVAQSQAAAVVKAEKFPITFSGARDAPVHAGPQAMFNTDHYVQLQPWRWTAKPGNRQLRPTREIHLMGDQAIPLDNLWQLGAAVESEPVTNWASFIEREMAAAPAPVREKAAGLQTLVSARERADWLPAYSIDFTNHPDQIMEEVMGGLKKAIAENPATFNKPILVPVLTEFKTPEQRAALETAMQAMGIGSVDVRAGELGARLASAKPGEVLLVQVGQLPPPVFEAMFKEATLPALLEGKNLTQTMANAGKPFLNILGDIDDIKPELFGAGASEEARSLINQAYGAFSMRQFRMKMFEEGNRNAIARFFAGAKNADGPVQSFFRTMKADPANLEKDMVARALIELKKALKEHAARPPKPPLHLPPGALTAPSAPPCAPQFQRLGRGGRGYSM